MMRFNQKMFLTSLLVLGSLTAFTTATQTAFAKESSKATASTAAPVKTTGFTSLQSVVSKTKSAVNSGDYAKAKAEFSKFEDSWKKVEDSVKKKSPDAYKAIENDVEAIMKEVKAAKPDKAKLLGLLQSADQAIAKAAKA